MRLESGEEIAADHVVLAVGHSARDVFQMLLDRGVAIEAKPFSIGFRIEHPQSLIDKARFGASRQELGAAEYRLVHHASNGRDVYSFCMCPGGTVVAAASEPGRVVTNGMSQYSRNERNANAGIVVGITPEDYPMAIAAGGHGVAAALGSAGLCRGRRHLCRAGAARGRFPGGRGRPPRWAASSRPTGPGVTPTDLSACLPDYAIAAIREALTAFGRQIKGFDMDDAVLTGVETRTSSPGAHRRAARISRAPICSGLYPAGEGAGYAGGILSAGGGRHQGRGSRGAGHRRALSAEEFRDEFASAGSRRTSAGAPYLLDPAGIHHRHQIGHGEGLVLVMGDEDRGDAGLVMDMAQPDAQFLAHLGVQRAERLVQQQHARLDRQRPGQRHALALAAGQLAGIALAQILQLHQLQQFLDPALDLGARRAARARGRTFRPKAMFLATVMCRNRAYCWKTKPALRSRAGMSSQFRSAKRTAPLSACSSPPRMRSSVVLPEPDGPSSATKAPCGAVRLTPFERGKAAEASW